MPAFLSALIAKVTAFLSSKVGTLLGIVLSYVLEKTVVKLWNWITRSIQTWLERRRRAKDQKEKQEALERDIQEGKPRTPETDKTIDDWINS